MIARLVWICDEYTWHHKTVLVQLYWHLAIKLLFFVTEIWTVELELASEIPSLPDNSILSDSGHTATQHNYLWELQTTSPPTACFPSSVYFKSLVLDEIWTVELELASEAPPLPDSSVFSDSGYTGSVMRALQTTSPPTACFPCIV